MNTIQSSVIAGLLLFAGHCAGAGELPNILVFLMDDMGYGDCRAYNPDGLVELPNMEKLAKDGMLFTDAHSPSAVCAPTRYSLLTGNYPWRGRNENGTWAFNHPSQILPRQETLAHVLKRSGYRTAFFGKVHLGGRVYSKSTGEPLEGWKIDYTDIDFNRPIGQGPVEQGFDYSYSLPNGIQGKPYAFFENGRLVGSPDELKLWKKGEYGNSIVKATGFGAADWDSSQAGPILTEKALAFLDRHFAENKGKPFYMHYCSQACHTPHSPPDELGGVPVRGVSGIDPKLDMIFEADVTLGLIMKKLHEAGQLENTLIIFTSDNGGLVWGEERKQGHQACGPLRGAKSLIWEGGHRVPFIACWAKAIEPGSRSDALIGLQDIYATLVELTRQSLEPSQGLDSQSFLSVLTGDTTTSPCRTLFVQANEEDVDGQRLMKMVRDGDWKLITTRDLKPVELYNLKYDLSEKNNLINHPEQQGRIERMHNELKRIMNSKRST
jgi:arylsulfatase A-like enzyme